MSITHTLDSNSFFISRVSINSSRSTPLKSHRHDSNPVGLHSGVYLRFRCSRRDQPSGRLHFTRFIVSLLSILRKPLLILWQDLIIVIFLSPQRHYNPHPAVMWLESLPAWVGCTFNSTLFQFLVKKMSVSLVPTQYPLISYPSLVSKESFDLFS